MDMTKCIMNVNPEFINSILKQGSERNYRFTTQRLPFFLYFFVGYYLTKVKTNKLGEGMFQPWDSGPVIPLVHWTFIEYSNYYVDEYIKTYNPKSLKLEARFVETKDKTFYKILNKFWNIYTSLSRFEAYINIADVIRSRDGAWDIARKNKSSFLNDNDIKRDMQCIIDQYGKYL